MTTHVPVETEGTVVVALGNPILSDDGAGAAALSLVREAEGERSGLAYRHAPMGGLALMEELVGYRRAVLIDAMVTGAPPGTVRLVPLSELGGTRNLASAHDTCLATALRAARILGLPLPEAVAVLGIEAGDVETFGEVLTPAVERGSREAARTVSTLLRSAEGWEEVP